MLIVEGWTWTTSAKAERQSRRTLIAYITVLLRFGTLVSLFCFMVRPLCGSHYESSFELSDGDVSDRSMKRTAFIRSGLLILEKETERGKSSCVLYVCLQVHSNIRCSKGRRASFFDGPRSTGSDAGLSPMGEGYPTVPFSSRSREKGGCGRFAMPPWSVVGGWERLDLSGRWRGRCGREAVVGGGKGRDDVPDFYLGAKSSIISREKALFFFVFFCY